jgi:hypothetical protein
VWWRDSPRSWPSHPAAIDAHQGALRAAERDLAEAEDHLDHLLASAAQGGPDVRELREDWPKLDLDDRGEILRDGIDAVLVRKSGTRAPVRERIFVLFHGDAPAGLTDNGRSGPVIAWS